MRFLGADGRLGEASLPTARGEQQRVAIARVLAMRPDIVFADEPTGSLDTASGAAALQLLRTAADRGSSVTVVTHALEAAALADPAPVLRDGRIHTELRNATPEQVPQEITLARADA